MSEESQKVIADNRQAFHNYEVIEKIEAGIVLTGPEVKSARAGEVNLRESYVREHRSELFLVQCHFTPYSFGRQDEQEPMRERKLLLHKNEIEKLVSQISRKGLTVIPLKMYFKGAKIKVQLGIGRGKKLHDKRQDLKKKEANREMERAIRSKRE